MDVANAPQKAFELCRDQKRLMNHIQLIHQRFIKDSSRIHPMFSKQKAAQG